MSNETRNLLTVLKKELEFLEKNGYHKTARAPWRPQLSVTKVTNRRAIRHATIDMANSGIYSGCVLLAGTAMPSLDY